MGSFARLKPIIWGHPNTACWNSYLDQSNSDSKARSWIKKKKKNQRKMQCPLYPASPNVNLGCNYSTLSKPGRWHCRSLCCCKHREKSGQQKFSCRILPSVPSHRWHCHLSLSDSWSYPPRSQYSDVDRRADEQTDIRTKQITISKKTFS